MNRNDTKRDSQAASLTGAEILSHLSDHASFLRDTFGIKTLGLFGSYSKREDKQTSDIDLLVEFTRTTFDAYMDLKFNLEEMFTRNVDLVIKDSIKPRLKERILSEVRNVEGF